MKQQKFFYIGFTVLSAIFLMSAAIIGYLVNENRDSIFTAAERDGICIVIDPGHGGEDGGCVSDSGILEKDLNLAVGEKISLILNSMGYNTIMTRSSDKMLYDMYGDDYTGKKKTYDLKNRLIFARENSADVFVSIHMNKFPQSKYSGLQVYYSGNHTDSMVLASQIREHNMLYLQKDNEREIKKSGTNIYLLDRIDVPAVLIECGFLSNEAEAIKLTDENYQRELSFMIAASLMSHFES